MLDKSNTLKAISLVLKRDILPNLNNDVAKEQTIAILALLKNIDATTLPNDEPFKSVNSLLLAELEVSLETMKQQNSFIVNDKLTMFQQELKTLAKQEIKEREKWESLNSLFSEMIQFAYQNSELHPFIDELRKIMRKQLNIEMKTVH
jgi:GTPase involved in cell partitioning and DNA repair